MLETHEGAQCPSLHKACQTSITVPAAPTRQPQPTGTSPQGTGGAAPSSLPVHPPPAPPMVLGLCGEVLQGAAKVASARHQELLPCWRQPVPASCRHPGQRRRGRCSRGQSRDSSAAHGEDRGDAGCVPAACEGPHHSRHPPCSPWRTPHWSGLFLTGCTPWEGPTLELFHILFYPRPAEERE